MGGGLPRTRLAVQSRHFDDTSPSVTAQALQVGSKPPAGLPDGFSSYFGYNLVGAIAQPSRGWPGWVTQLRDVSGGRA